MKRTLVAWRLIALCGMFSLVVLTRAGPHTVNAQPLPHAAIQPAYLTGVSNQDAGLRQLVDGGYFDGLASLGVGRPTLLPSIALPASYQSADLADRSRRIDALGFSMNTVLVIFGADTVTGAAAERGDTGAGHHYVFVTPTAPTPVFSAAYELVNTLANVGYMNQSNVWTADYRDITTDPAYSCWGGTGSFVDNVVPAYAVNGVCLQPRPLAMH